MQKQQQRKRW